MKNINYERSSTKVMIHTYLIITNIFPVAEFLNS